jgi:Ca2+/H+ antiporter, TMEM165/GDT1 family
MKRHKRKFWLILPLIIVAIGLFIWFFQWLWNILLPEILGVKSINYWQAFGILVLSKILFGGMNFKKHDGKFRRKMQDFREQNFTDEERMKFRNEWIEKLREKCKNS